jgi:hypothetical protein
LPVSFLICKGIKQKGTMNRKQTIALVAAMVFADIAPALAAADQPDAAMEQVVSSPTTVPAQTPPQETPAPVATAPVQTHAPVTENLLSAMKVYPTF